MGRKARIVLGLNSGTSADGVDAVACRITGRGLHMGVRVIGYLARRYPPTLRRRLLDAMAPARTSTEEICRLHAEVGRAFARTAAAAIKRFGLRRIDLVGSHGQTICHLPPKAGPRRKTARASTSVSGGSLQIGDAAIISAALETPVVWQFRQADMAVGGQGAPLVPWTDYVLFQDAGRNRVVQNLGGIANVTWLPAGGTIEDVLAFDTGPGNMLIDALVSHFTKGRQAYDKGGALARRGSVRDDLLASMLDHPYLALRPPKSCGREAFGVGWMKDMLRRFKRRGISPEDWIATATRCTALSIDRGYALLLKASGRVEPYIDEIILCGGGAKNKTLVKEIAAATALDGGPAKKLFPCHEEPRASARAERHMARNEAVSKKIRITTTADYGISVQAKEGVSFAMLAAACVDGVSANLPGVTGADRPVVLGQICDIGAIK